MAVTREQIIRRGRCKVLPVPSKTLRQESEKESPTCYIRELSGLERDQWAASIHGRDGTLDPTCRVRLVQLTLCDADGNRHFSDNDFDVVAQLSAPFIEEVSDASLAFNKLAQSDVDETLGNSESGPTDSSGSVLQPTLA